MTASQRIRTFRPALEALENRTVPTVTTAQNSNLLTLTSNGADDVVTVSQWFALSLVRGVTVTVNGADAGIFLGVDRIEFKGNGGKDTFTNDTGITCEANGGSGNDVLTGGGGADGLIGGSGNDQLVGRGGNDSLTGGTDNDVLDGGDGNDGLNGQGGRDTVSGGGGDDSLDGGTDNDKLFGNDGKDSLTGGSGSDKLFGGNDLATDELTGNSGNDDFRIDPDIVDVIFFSIPNQTVKDFRVGDRFV
jgi:Ca2+-binding RTX toxin-like protein